AVPSDRPIGAGELLTLDFGAQVEGYKSDMTRTIAIGEVSDSLRAVYDAVLAAQTAALAAVRPGARCADIDRLAREMLDRDYPGAFGHSLGHGVGLNIHELPGLSARDAHVLEPGHVVTVEPGVYLPGVGGCRIEDMGYVDEGGFVNLITAPKHLISVPV
ncbi:MAG: M24 family metallopeptidase, partial [Clostridiales bacterium]|nr:M24 family metallopeptidase [Clostridiales bacterium]